MHRFLQYTLDLFEPLALADSTQHAPEIVAFIAPGVPHGEAQVLNRVIVPAVFTHPRANRELRLGDAQVALVFGGLGSLSFFFVFAMVEFIPVWRTWHSVVFIGYWAALFIFLFTLTKRTKPPQKA